MPKCGSPFFIVLFKIQFTIQQQPGNDAEEGSLDQQEEDHASLGEVESLCGVGFEDLAEGVEDAEVHACAAADGGERRADHVEADQGDDTHQDPVVIELVTDGNTCVDADDGSRRAQDEHQHEEDSGANCVGQVFEQFRVGEDFRNSLENADAAGSQGGEKDRKEGDDRAQHGPDQDAEDFRGDQRCRICGQGEHQVALKTQKILIKAGHGQHAGHDDDRHHQDAVKHEDQDAGKPAKEVLRQELDAQAGKQSKAQQCRV